RVRMLDFGNRDTEYEDLVPAAPFSEIRRTDGDQHRYFLGDRFEGVSFGETDSGAQLTPPRTFVERDTDTLAPVDSDTFHPLQSLAQGGLAAAWGAGCPPFIDRDLEGFAISQADLAPHYEAVAARIGVSGRTDDLTPHLGELGALQPAAEIDTNATRILELYRRRSPRLNASGFYLGLPRLAMLSKPINGRAATSYRDMDFWTDQERSVYRPRWTVEELGSHPNFTYDDRLLVESFSEPRPGEVEVSARAHPSGESRSYRAHSLVIAAGALGTARIVLRSLERYDHRVPLVCNPHTYCPMINLRMLGRPAADRRHSMAQLCFVHAPEGEPGLTVGHVYSYRSLLAFKLVRESPLPHRGSARIIRSLIPALTIALLQHADEPTADKYCSLRRRGDGDTLEIGYALSEKEEQRVERIERSIVRHFRSLRCVPIRRVRTGHAASAHYAGCFPMASDGGELTTESSGRLRGTESVYLVDGSVFPRLPSKGLTFTMMANADRVGTQLGRALSS
ncbi:MAG TPA: GMC oxidoreductase, partial [Solirubrobacterales bacterium]